MGTGCSREDDGTCKAACVASANGADFAPSVIGDEPAFHSLSTDDIQRKGGQHGHSVYSEDTTAELEESTGREDEEAARSRLLEECAEARRRGEEIERAVAASKARRQTEAVAPHVFGQWAQFALFLGRDLPGHFSQLADAEVLETMRSALQSQVCVSGCLDSSVVAMGLAFCDMHRPSGRAQADEGCSALAAPDTYRIKQGLMSLTAPGSQWACWVQTQNSMIFVERVSDSLGRVSTWLVQPQPQDALRVVPGWLRVPEAATEVPWSLLLSDNFSNRLAEIAAAPLVPGKPSDPANHAALADFLLPALGGTSVDLSRGDGLCIGKKLRDESRLAADSKMLQPWRRPAVFLALKAILHFGCVRASCSRGQGSRQGSAAYKSFMARMLGQALLNGEHGLIDDSARVEAARKVARRLHKLQNSGFAGDAVASVSQMLHRAMLPVQQRWQQQCEQCVPAVVRESELNFSQDVVHSLPNSRPKLEELCRDTTAAASTKVQAPKCQPRADTTLKKVFLQHQVRLEVILQQDADAAALQIARQREQEKLASRRRPVSLKPAASRKSPAKAKGGAAAEAAPPPALGVSEHDNAVTALFDAERDVAALWEQWDATKTAPIAADDVLKAVPFLQAYSKLAAKVYKHDVEGRSRMVLLMVAVVLLLDRHAASESAVLLDHPIGLDETMLHFLLLSRARDKKLLHALEVYMEQRKARQLPQCTGILHPEIHESSFSVRFARQDQLCKDTLENILNRCARNQELKEKELKEQMLARERLFAEREKMKCVCSTFNTNNPAADMARAKDGSTVCSYCRWGRRAINLTCSFYEQLLPTDPCERQAIVFELVMPLHLGVLRSALYHLAQRCAVGLIEEDCGILGMWGAQPSKEESGPRLPVDNPKAVQFSWNGLTNWVRSGNWRGDVQLAYTDAVKLPVDPIIEHVVDKEKWKTLTTTADRVAYLTPLFLIENYRDVALADVVKKKCLGTEFTWSVKELLKAETDDPRYQSLQFAVQSWKHTENEVIAKQFTAHAELSLREYGSFGCLRAGIRLQLPRLARALAQQALAFDRKGVLDVLTSLLYQVGPPAAVGEAGKGAWRRQAHELLGQKYFCDDLCAHATALLEQQASNWTRHLLLLVIVRIGRHILSHSPVVAGAMDAPVKLLRACRSVACDWIRDVRGAMARANDEDMQKLRSKLVDIAATANLTYDVQAATSKGSNVLMNSEEDAATFIWLRAVLSDNILLRNTRLDKLDAFRLNLLRDALRLTLEVEDALHKICTTTAALTNFLRRHWCDASSGSCEQWRQQPKPEHRWFETTFSGTTGGKSILQVDVVRGAFLVNGAPVGRLPKSISLHEDYVGVFGESIFDVQPALGGGWRTLPGKDGSTFSFFKPANNAQAQAPPTIIEERLMPDGQRIQARLVSRGFLRGDVPDALVEQHSHWLVKGPEEPKVYFRPQQHDAPMFKFGCSETGAEYILSLKTSLIVHSGSKRQLVDVQSGTFEELYSNVFHRLAPRGRVHVFAGGSSLAAEAGLVVLPQLHGLQFRVEGSRIRSHEFGSFVALNQSLGTLVGLQHGLLLKESSGERTLLVPHAEASRTPGQQAVSLQIDSLRTPPLFVYRAREDLQELHGQKDRLAWLFLAMLHAITSSPLPDPFLGRTGTAQALQLLASGRCRGNLDAAGGWTSATADATLVEIARCSPTREIVENKQTAQHCAERVSYGGQSLPTLCAHDGFGWLVNCMRKEARQAARFADREHDYDNAMVLGGDGSAATGALKNLVNNASRRAYLRSRELYPTEARLTVQDEFDIMGPMQAALNLQPWPIRPENALEHKGVRAVAVPMCRRTPSRITADLKSLMIQRGWSREIVKVRGFTAEQHHKNSFRTWQAMLNIPPPYVSEWWLANYWLDLYDIARRCAGEEDLFSLSTCLSYLAQLDAQYTDHLVQLMNIAVLADAFQDLPPPTHRVYENPAESGFQRMVVSEVIDKYLDKKRTAGSTMNLIEPARGNPVAESKLTAKHEEAVKTAKENIIMAAMTAYNEGGILTPAACEGPRVSSASSVAQGINDLFGRWRQNQELHSFLAAVAQRLAGLSDKFATFSTEELGMEGRHPEDASIRPGMFRLAHEFPAGITLEQDERTSWELGSYSPGKLFAKKESPPETSPEVPELPVAGGREAVHVYERLLHALREGWTLAHAARGGKFQQDHVAGHLDAKELSTRLRKYHEVARDDMDHVFERLGRAIAGPGDPASKAMQTSGLMMSASPTSFLRCLQDESCTPEWRAAVGAFAVRLRHEQRARRCLRLLRRGDRSAVERELSNDGCGNWTPVQRPEWLLLELDNDFCIREQQATVAEAIMSDECGNRLLQYIMGAGKTSVIIPMVIASLADCRRCMRVTVIGPLYATNATDWQLKLGGLLKRRVHSLPCRREMRIERHSKEILTFLKDMTANQHVLVTVPEHRLSMENKALELALSGDPESSLALQRVLQYLADNGRDVLDEADEILHPKFQLIYALGKPMVLDGGSLRWVAGTAVLHSVARHAARVKEEFGDGAVEFDRSGREGEQQFPAIRLLEGARESGAYERLCELVVDDFLSGFHPQVPVVLRPQEAAAWREAVLNKEAPEGTWQTFPENLQKLALLLRGLLAHMLLYGALHKRWRVDYGGHLQGLRRMAVPYRAKDVAAERTEFGHPDVALLLTILHYYHRGLSRDQVEEVFLRLSRKGAVEAQAIYAIWADAAPTLEVRTWTGVNLDDSEQFDTKIVPALQKHMQVINFWLDQVVFPTEAKQFGEKMVANAWDLCRGDISGITTGFSGTDDAHLLLPLTIRQSNMDELKMANSFVLYNLLQKENDVYTPLPIGASGKAILELISDDPSIDVLLDPGALVLELSHREVAELWLAKRPDRSAAVYFEGDRIDVVDRTGVTMPLAVSPFENALWDCLLYLDDEHTRGSDFKLPRGRRAAVTLGRGMQKDKLLQACMRMRRLGDGHSVCFLASFEADLQVQSWRVTDGKFKGRHSFRDRMATKLHLEHLPAIVSWCLSNTVWSTCDKLPYLVTQGATQLKKRHACSRFQGQTTLMSQECAMKEASTLRELYGYSGVVQRLPETIQQQLVGVLGHLDGVMNESMVTMAASMMAHVRQLVPDVSRASWLAEEEHERELEEELEEETEYAARPAPATPCIPRVCDEVIEFVRSGQLSEELPRVLDSLRHTTFARSLTGDWGSRTFVTPDFMHTVEEEDEMDNYLRPVTWMLSNKNGTLLISNFEAEHLANAFIDRKSKCTMNLITPAVRMQQGPALPSLPNQIEPPVPLHLFAGSAHGDEDFLREARAFLGLCPRLPASATWREFFEQRHIIDSDGFVPPQFRQEVSSRLGLQFRPAFERSPLGMLKALYGSRHLTEDLAASPIGQLVGLTDLSAERAGCTSRKTMTLAQATKAAAAAAAQDARNAAAAAAEKPVKRAAPKQSVQSRAQQLKRISQMHSGRMTAGLLASKASKLAADLQ
eukprot:TRINITY_DN22673_c0_g1_i1.p1 TRINITY_DN22673_c0_g1~~TRINITY_DN22673_c0_g1_i1.p1  ORF type:complete len:3475 (-),score=733.29 TRINITY_DN22673_c0_g1_i1:80-10504(-)